MKPYKDFLLQKRNKILNSFTYFILGLRKPFIKIIDSELDEIEEYEIVNRKRAHKEFLEIAKGKINLKKSCDYSDHYCSYDDLIESSLREIRTWRKRFLAIEKRDASEREIEEFLAIPSCDFYKKSPEQNLEEISSAAT